ncbi:MAG TPA: hypothetical protein VMU88_03765 [bacterium]|nr:hypothetical protein [bacterium]
METPDYVPGACNIGPQERILRRTLGYVCVGFFIALFLAFDLTHAPYSLRLILFIPAFIGAVGFFQDLAGFCVNYGMRGLFNLKYAAGATQSVTDGEARRLDREKSLEILAYSLAAALAVTYLALMF